MITKNKLVFADVQYELSTTDVIIAKHRKKKMVVSLNGNIKVIVNTTVVYNGIQPYSAMELYNQY